MVLINRKEEKESEEEMRNWSELPRNVLSGIARRLTVGTDRVRFSEVCRNWSSVAKSKFNFLPCSPPWLMLETYYGSSLCLFVSAGGMQMFELDLPEISGSVCVGSTGCWLVLVDHARNLYLLNPLSRARIDLPNVCAYDDEGEFTVDFEAEKVILSFLNSDSVSDSGSNFDFVAMIICDDARTLAYTRKGANSWQALESPRCSFVDIIFFNGRFYALDSCGILFKCLGGCSPHKLVRVSDELDDIYYEDVDCQIKGRYLVQINGCMILQVIKIEWDGEKYIRPGFRYFIINHITGRWVETNHLYENSVFLGCSTSVGILSSSSVNLKPNCIYFPESRGDFDVYNQLDKTIVTHYGSLPLFTRYLPTSWIVPTSLSVRRVPASLSGEEMRNWSELPRKVLRVIARWLTVGTDRVRFSEVCWNWSSVAKSMSNYLPCCPPWLMLDKKRDGSSLRLFCSAGGMQSFELDLPEIRHSVCVGSTGCWVFMVDQSWNLYLLNPLSRAKIDLPNVCAYDNDGEYSEIDLIFLVEFEAEKVVLSFLNSDSVSDSDTEFIAMVIFDEASTLAYTKKGVNSWQALASPPCSFVDILFFNGQFYALDSRGILFKCLIGCSPHTLVQVSDELEEIYFEDDCEIQGRYLVQFYGWIVQVVKIKWIDPEYPSWEFRVVMYDKYLSGWGETYLGEHSLFLGQNTSVAILSSSSINLKPNCIYTECLCRNLGVYKPRDSSAVRHYYTGRFSLHPLAPIYPISWIVPTSLSVRRVPTSLSGEEMRNWSELPRDVLGVIARRLEVGQDRVRFSEVCRKWSSVAKSEINYLPCSPPWLMLYEKLGTNLRHFVSASGMQRFELDLPEIRRSRCVGSTGCWVVMRDIDHALKLFLLNPVSRDRIYLPNVCVYYDDGEYSEINLLDEFESEKVIFSFLNSDSDSDSDSYSDSDSDAYSDSGSDFVFVAMAIFDEGSTLAYTRKGANSWEALASPPSCSFVDILYVNGQFYALDYHGILFKCLIGCSPHTLVQVSDESEEIYCEDIDSEFKERFLVQIYGCMILQVVKITKWIDDGKNQTPEFHVFIFNHIAGRWVETYHLGEYSLLLSYSPSVAISSTSSNNIKPNCIYYRDSRNVYDLRDSTVSCYSLHR